MKFGLIGFPLGHSFSKAFFEAKFQNESLTGFTYDNFPVEDIDSIKALLQTDVFGFNITIPYKSVILDYINDVDEAAFKIGAVNTLVRTSEDSWKGYNTDWSGFRESLLEWLIGAPIPQKALILGTGGAAKAIRFTLHQLGIITSSVSSQGHGDYAYEGLSEDLIAEHHLIINATPWGMMTE